METSRWVRRGVSALVLLLITIGVIAAIARVVFPVDVIQRMEPWRAGIIEAWQRGDPLAAQRPAELARMDGSFAEHRFLTLLHIVPGGLFLVFAPLQFSARIRARRQLHRYSGWLLITLISASVLPGLFFGIVLPFGGRSEAVMIAAAGIFLLYSIAAAVRAIRGGDTARHREWMIRMFGNALAISTVRLIGAPIEFLLTPYAVPPAQRFVVAIWTAWLLALGGAEWWIGYTRRHEGTKDTKYLGVSPS